MEWTHRVYGCPQNLQDGEGVQARVGAQRAGSMSKAEAIFIFDCMSGHEDAHKKMVYVNKT
jgi:hypothetical protein